MGSHNVCTHWMYQYYVLYLAWWWLNEPKHVAEFLIFIILITNICCVYWLNKLLYYCKTQRDGSCQSRWINSKWQISKMKGTFKKLCNTHSNKITLTLKMYVFLWKSNDFPIIIGRHIPKSAHLTQHKG